MEFSTLERRAFLFIHTFIHRFIHTVCHTRSLSSRFTARIYRFVVFSFPPLVRFLGGGEQRHFALKLMEADFLTKKGRGVRHTGISLANWELEGGLMVLDGCGELLEKVRAREKVPVPGLGGRGGLKLGRRG